MFGLTVEIMLMAALLITAAIFNLNLINNFYNYKWTIVPSIIGLLCGTAAITCNIISILTGTVIFENIAFLSALSTLILIPIIIVSFLIHDC